MTSCRGRMEATSTEGKSSRFIAAGAVKVEGTHGTVPNMCTISPGSLFKGEDNEFIFAVAQGKVRRRRLRPPKPSN